MKTKTAIGGTLYLVCAILSGLSLIVSDPSSYSLIPFMGGLFALVWLFASVWAFRELGNVHFTQYHTEVDRYTDYDLIIVTASKRVANQSSIGFLAGIGMIILIFLLEGMYNPMAIISDYTNLMNLIAGALSILSSMILRSVTK
ncbi:MAG: hypothetical protein ACFFED_17715 [Candidatus Thorarchaeota archaeon]